MQIESKNTQNVNLVRRGDNPKPQNNSCESLDRLRELVLGMATLLTMHVKKVAHAAKVKNFKVCENCYKTKAANKKPHSKPASGGRHNIKLVKK